MPRTSLVHYINPSAVSITANANGQQNDLAVFLPRGTKIKVYEPRIFYLGTEDASYQEWTLSGRNRRLSDPEGDTPYTIYARLRKVTDYSDPDNVRAAKADGYIVFAKQEYGEDGEWHDPYVLSPNTNAYGGMSSTGADGRIYTWQPIPLRQSQDGRSDYWWIKIGTVSAAVGGRRTVDLDTGILGTDQFNTEWMMDADDPPYRVELSCQVDGREAGLTPYILWDKSAVLSALLVKGWDEDASSKVLFWTITRNTGSDGADDAWNFPGDSSSSSSDAHDPSDARRMADGTIVLSHLRGDDDDFAAAVAATFTVTAWGYKEPEPDSSSSSSEITDGDSSSSSSGVAEIVPLSVAHITMLAETVESYSIEVSAAIVSYNPETQAYSPANGVAVRLRAKSQDGKVFFMTDEQIQTALLHVYYQPVGDGDSSTSDSDSDESLPSELVFSGGVASLPTSAFADGKSIDMWLENDAQVELDRTTVAYVRYGAKGDTPINCYRWYRDGLTPLKPTDTSSDSPAPASGDATGAANVFPIDRWSATAPGRPSSGEWALWQCGSVRHGDDTREAWQGPVRISGTKGDAGEDASDQETIYQRLNVYPFSGNLPSSIIHGTIPDPANPGQRIDSDDKTKDGWVPTGWSDTAIPAEAGAKYVYASIRKKAAGHDEQWGDFGTPFLWTNWGVQGMDGDGVQYLFKLFDHELTDQERMSERPQNATFNETTKEWEASGWSDDPQSPVYNMKFCYCAVIEKIGGSWSTDAQGYGVFKKLGLWSKWADDGESNLMIDIDNDNDQFGVDADGKVLVQQTRSTVVSMLYGTHHQAFVEIPDISLKYDDGTSVPSSVAVASVSELSDSSSSSSDSSSSGGNKTEYEVTVTVKATGTNTPVFTKTGKNGLYVDITGSCAKGGPRIIRFSLEKVMSGAAGVSPTIYQLALSQKSFSYGRSSDNSLVAKSNSVTVSVKETTGSQSVIKTLAQSGKTCTYKLETEATAHSVDVNNPVITIPASDVGSNTKVIVTLSTGDSEELPIVMDGAGQPSYIETQEAWSNEESTASATTCPSDCVEDASHTYWYGYTPSNTRGRSYLWRRSRTMTLDGTTRSYTPGTWTYTRLSGTNGTSIKTKGTIAIVVATGGTLPTTGMSVGDIGVKQDDPTPWSFNGTSWSHLSDAADDGDSYVVSKDCTVDLDGDGTATNIKGHLVMWSNEAHQADPSKGWIDLGQFKGDSGTTYYTHLAWATSVDTSHPWSGSLPDGQISTPTVASASDVTGGSMSPSSSKPWMGVLINTSNGADTTNWHYYTWQYTRGPQGENAARLSLDNEHEDFLYSDDGLVSPPGGATSSIRFRVGSTDLTGSVVIQVYDDNTQSWGTSTGSGASAEASVTQAGSTAVLSVVSLRQDAVTVKVRTEYPVSSGIYHFAEFTANKTKQDKYELVVRPSAIAFNSSEPWTDKELTVSATMTDGQGNQSPAAISTTSDSGALRLFMGYINDDGSVSGLARQTDLTPTIGSAVASAYMGIYFELRKYMSDSAQDSSGDYSIRDHETVEIAKTRNGDSAVQAVLNPNAAFIATDKDGNVGTEKISAHSFEYYLGGVRQNNAFDSITCKIDNTTLDNAYHDENTPRKFFKVVLESSSGRLTGGITLYVSSSLTGLSSEVMEVTGVMTIDGVSVSRTLALPVKALRQGSDGSDGQPGDDAVMLKADPENVIITQSTTKDSQGHFPLVVEETWVVGGTTYSILGSTQLKIADGGTEKVTGFTVGTPVPSKIPGTQTDCCTVVKNGTKVGITGIGSTASGYVTSGYVTIPVTYGGKNYSVSLKFNCELLGDWKESVENGVETAVGEHLGYAIDPSGNIDTIAECGTFIRGWAENTAKLEKTVAAVNLLPSSCYTDVYGTVLSSGFDEERQAVSADMYSPLIILDPGYYCVSAYCAATPAITYLYKSTRPTGPNDGTTAAALSFAELTTDTYDSKSRWYAYFTVSQRTYIYLRLNGSTNPILRAMIEQTAASDDKPTPWEMGAKYYTSQINQKAEAVNIEVSGKIPSINLMSLLNWKTGNGGATALSNGDVKTGLIGYGNPLFSPMMYLDAGTYTFSAYMDSAQVYVEERVSETAIASLQEITMTSSSESYKSKTRRYGSFTLANAAYVRIKTNVNAQTSTYIYRPQLEIGSVMRSYVPSVDANGTTGYIDVKANEVSVGIRNGLLNTGINITSGKVAVHGGDFTMQDENGNDTFVLDEDGNLQSQGDASFGGTIKAKNFFHGVCICDPNGASDVRYKNSIALYIVDATSFKSYASDAGFLSEVQDVQTGDVLPLSEDSYPQTYAYVTVNNQPSFVSSAKYCTGYADEIIWLSTTSASSYYNIILPPAASCVGKKVTVYNKAYNDYGITVYSADSTNETVSNKGYLDANGNFVVGTSAHPGEGVSIDQNNACMFQAFDTGWLALVHIKDKDNR